MPIYEYSCKRCAHDFETLVLGDEGDEAIECPKCQGAELERRLSVPAAPQVSAGLPMACNPSLPPCGPGCCRL